MRIWLPMAMAALMGMTVATAAAGNPWRAPAEPEASGPQFPPLESETRGNAQSPSPATNGAPQPMYPPASNGALAPVPSAPSPYGQQPPGYGAYPGYPNYPGGAYPYSSPTPYGQPYGDPVLRDSLFRSGGWGFFPGGW